MVDVKSKLIRSPRIWIYFSFDEQYDLPGTICGGLSPPKACPKGYIQGPQLCYKDDRKAEDASGTFCGYFFQGFGSSCGNLLLGNCPEGFTGISFPTYNTYMCVRE